jgi:hypothetical protein
MSKRQSFKRNEASKYKIRQILHDIDEARTYGISLRNNISLNELYSYLADARKQKKEHDKKRPKGRFQYDDGVEEQPPLDDGLDELTDKVKVRRASRRKKRRGSRGSRRGKSRA